MVGNNESFYIRHVAGIARRGEARLRGSKIRGERSLPPLFLHVRFHHDHAKLYNDANRGRRAPIECLDRIFTRGTGLVSSVCAVYMYTYDAWKRVNWSGREGGREKKVFSRDREESMGPDRRGRGRRRGEASVALLLDGDR